MGINKAGTVFEAALQASGIVSYPDPALRACSRAHKHFGLGYLKKMPFGH